MSAVDTHVRQTERVRFSGTTAGKVINLRTWLIATVLFDMLFALTAGLVSAAFRFGGATSSPATVAVLAAALPLIWVTVLAARGAYDRRWATSGSEPFRRIFDSGVVLLAIAAIASFLFKADLSRQWVGVTCLLVTPLTLVGRYAGRKQLHHMIGRGRAIHQVLVAGSAREVARVVRHIRRVPYTGFSVLAVCVLDGDSHVLLGGVPAFDSDINGLLPTAQAVGADTIAIAGSASLPEDGLRRLAWKLEGTSVQLIVAPAVTDFAGPRIVIRPVDGLPLLTIDEPDLVGARRIAKELLDWFLALFALVVLSPLILAVSIAILVTSGRPIFFRQDRIGRHGTPFAIWKFRTMYTDAEHRLEELREHNEHEGFLFKIRQDPRVTPLGRWLRRHSIDEVPQLFNVLQGEMSLVGPRPPLPREVEQFGEDLLRRLLVKPGMTGLWQINGRTDLPWDEAVRLDLHYVENWSVTLDLMVLWKTLAVVLHGRGGY
jgi:exopolysaccharide biosynthesis polyprenyl glycosylphosphotransferase